MSKKTPTVLLRDKGEFTKFQILLEIMRNQPHIKQKNISDKLGITIQAISKYFKKLAKEGMIEVGSERVDYRLTSKGVVKLRDGVRALENYLMEVKHDLKIEHAWPAIATEQVKTGQEIGLVLREGVMYTTDVNNSETKGIILGNANPGEDVGIKELHGKLQMKRGRILIIKLPSIRKGGSRSADLINIKAFYDEFKPDRIGVMGAVGRAVLTKLNLKADIEFGISRSAAIAASRGLNVFVLVVGRMVNRMIQEIDEINMRSSAGIIYEVKDAQAR
jgi:putative transcriptional regulator